MTPSNAPVTANSPLLPIPRPDKGATAAVKFLTGKLDHEVTSDEPPYARRYVSLLAESNHIEFGDQATRITAPLFPYNTLIGVVLQELGVVVPP